MDIDTDIPPSTDHAVPPQSNDIPMVLDISEGPSGPIASTVSIDATAATPVGPRTLRARPSLPESATPATPSAARSPKVSTSHIRAPTATELSRIHRRLGPEAIQARRDELLSEKEKELREVVDGHDTAVREKFHLERFVTMITGWNPELAKQDNSPVFMDYKRFHHNLFDLAPPSLPGNAVAGPSRPRQSLPSRTTRRQAHEQTDIFSHPKAEDVAVAETAPILSKGKSRASDIGPNSADTKAKKKAAAIVPEEDLTMETPKLKHKMKIKSDRESMPPPSEPSRKKAWASLATEVIPVEDEGGSSGKVKAKPRMSLPDLPIKRGPGRPPKVLPVDGKAEAETTPVPAKRGPGRPPKVRLPEIMSSPSAQAETPLEEETAEIPPPTPTPAPPPLPSLAHVPFPPPPPRVRHRRIGPSKIWYTDPLQRPTPDPPFSGDLSSLLSSYILIDDPGPPPDIKFLELRAAREGYIRNRVNYLQSQGRLLRLLDESDNDPSLPATAKKTAVIPRKQDHRDHLMAHMRQVRGAMLDEAKNKPVYCKRIARMIMGYWEHLEGKEDREKAERERELKKKAREVIKALRKRWGLAVKIVKARKLEEAKAEQDRLGKEHLQNMLQRSTGLLEAQQTFGDDEDEDSEGTDDVSTVEESEADDEAQAAADGENDEMLVDETDPALETAETSDDGDDVDDVDENDDDDDEAGSEDSSVGDDDAEQADSDEEQERAENGHWANSEDLDGSEDVSEPDIRALVQEVQGRSASPLRDTLHSLSQTGPAPPVSSSNLLEDTSGMGESSILGGVAEAVISEVNGIASILDDAPTSPPDPLDDGHEQKITEESQPVGDEALAALSGNVVVLDSYGQNKSNEIETSDTTVQNGLPNGSASKPSAQPIIRSRRARKVATPAHLVQEVDPDADDVDFKDVAAGEAVDEQDHDMDVEMEDAEDEDRNSEDEGLLADANIPIEELLKRYGVPMKNSTQVMADSQPIEGSPAAENGMTNGEIGLVAIDQSLTDANIDIEHSPALIEGKRQRRIRQVWTPEDNPPPPPKRPKIEDVTPEGTPELSSEEETDDEEEENAEGIGADGDQTIHVEEDPNAPKTRPPFLLRGTLRPYQHAGLDWLAGLYANNMNGILADEMGLGKTIQTISLLGHLACDKGVWGQHLVIVPTSVILNWEMEFKKFLPGFKILTYYGNQKERKEKRIGWLTQHSWQVCITSYQIVLADQHIFRRKNWVYMILDEAHNIKNFRSQRWQILLGFKAQRRLLLTGTPLQNNLMELWSLLYFLMPHGVAEEATAVVGFANHKDFMEWFSNPMDKAVESGDVLDEQALVTVAKLHTLLRPFILRRLKSEVETQLPGKFEHVVYCKLSKRQRFLYDEFMSRSSTKEALTSGGYLGVMNTLMQLRKVCNHPDLFEVRPVRTSFAMERSVVADFEPADLIVRKRLLIQADQVDISAINLNITAHEDLSGWTAYARRQLEASDKLPHAIEVKVKGRQPAPPKLDTRTVEGWLKYRAWAEQEASIRRWRSLRDANRLRCRMGPIYGSTFLSMLRQIPQRFLPLGTDRTKRDLVHELVPPVASMVMSYEERQKGTQHLVEKFAVIPPIATARDLASYALPTLRPEGHPELLDPDFDTLHHASTKLQIAFPDSSLLQYDCGKLQKLAEMLRDLKAGGHRVLIFTQMTRVLDILEIFLNYNGHRYLRLDGSTKIEDRQIITERFNSDDKIFCFIASSRSGGVGINLTGADTVFFYDSDWNPSMDRQCMDRAHRIGQTREVHIYRFVSSHTVEENMLKKANQKRLLDKVIIQEGDFTTEFFGRVDWRETLYDGEDAKKEEGEEKEGVEDIEVEDEPEAEEVKEQAPRRGEEREFARMVAEVEDEEDVQAARVALGEGEMDMGDFEAEGAARKDIKRTTTGPETRADGTPTTPAVIGEGPMGEVVEGDEEEEDDVGAVDEYMLRLVDWDWAWFASYR